MADKPEPQSMYDLANIKGVKFSAPQHPDTSDEPALRAELNQVNQELVRKTAEVKKATDQANVWKDLAGQLRHCLKDIFETEGFWLTTSTREDIALVLGATEELEEVKPWKQK